MSYSDFDRGIPSTQIKRQHELEAASDNARRMFARWKESERILSILRTIKPFQEVISSKSMETWYSGVKCFSLPGENLSSFDFERPLDTPNKWFLSKFPEQGYRFGPPFLEYESEGITTPLLLNTDFFGAILKGEPALGHHVVFYPPERTWYFHDVRAQAFCPTTPAKIQLLASNYLIKCAEAVPGTKKLLPLLIDFRRKSVLLDVLQKAEAILEADKSFFQGSSGKVRLVNGVRVDPSTEPSTRIFMKKIMRAEPGAKAFISEVYAKYVNFCHENNLPVMTPSEAKKSLVEAVEEHYGLCLRHDVVVPHTGKHQHGWIGLTTV